MEPTRIWYLRLPLNWKRPKNGIAFSRIFILTDAKGMVVASSNPKAMKTLDIHDRNYFINAMKGETVISEVMVSRTTQKPILALATPV